MRLITLLLPELRVVRIDESVILEGEAKEKWPNPQIKVSFIQTWYKLLIPCRLFFHVPKEGKCFLIHIRRKSDDVHWPC
jgi:hypothetical protein